MEGLLKLIRQTLLFTWPVSALVSVYLLTDPFHVLKYYDSYPDNYLKSYNRNRISTQIFLNNNPSENYDSFIFGSSRSSVFYTKDWEKHINTDKTYHFDASNETISGIHGKIKFIKKHGNTIKNALIVLDEESFRYVADTANSVIHVGDWRWTGQNRLLYHWTFLKAFFKDFYFLKFAEVELSKEFKPHMYGFFENKHMLYTPIKNDFIFQGYMDEIKKDSVGYYERLFSNPIERKEVEGDQVIQAYQEVYLREIAAIFKEDDTNYRIVLGPNFDQKKFNADALEILENYFESNRIFDFTGKNEWTEPIGNYYEIYHYKPSVAQHLLTIIYGEMVKKP